MTGRPNGGSSTVTVVGGSATGLYTATLLAEAGRAVRVLEGADEYAPDARTLIVTRRMNDLPGGPGEGSIVNAINRFELVTNGRAATVTLDEPDLVIERSTLLRGMADRARAAGVDLQMGRRVQTLHGSGDGVTLEVGSNGATEELAASTVVGADGTFSKVARAAGWPPLQTVPLIQAIVRLPADLPSDTTRVWFHPDETPYFYWLIPESDQRGAVGLIGEDGQTTRRCLERFLERHRLEPIEFQAARIPCYTRWVPPQRRLGNADVYLVGDAAAHVKVTTVGGIVTGFRGALGVAEAILHGRHDALRRLRWELDWHWLLRRSLCRFRQDDYELLLDVLTPGTRGVLGTYTRDEAGRILLRLCLAQPRLILLAMRTLLLRPGRPAS
jgi:flavin-dependent dehydrogenase